jgi:hypothetical protein
MDSFDINPALLKDISKLITLSVEVLKDSLK